MTQEEKAKTYHDAIHKAIFIPNDGNILNDVNILHEYSQGIEDILKKIDKVEDVIKRFL